MAHARIRMLVLSILAAVTSFSAWKTFKCVWVAVDGNLALVNEMRRNVEDVNKAFACSSKSDF
jgi:nitrate/nitrite transporter NarK